jgi:hypothetical protein
LNSSPYIIRAIKPERISHIAWNTKIYLENLNKKYNLEELNVDRRIILNRSL